MALTLVRSNTALALLDDSATTREEITKATIERLHAMTGASADVYVQDSEIPGFKLRRTKQGTIVFLFHGRIRNGEGANKNKLVKRTIGTAKGEGSISIFKARAEASTLREALAKGLDPADELHARAEGAEAARRLREQQALHRVWTAAYALEHMLEWRASRPNPSLHFKPETIKFYKVAIGYLGKLAHVPIVDLRADQIRNALEQVDGKAKPTKARNALSGVIAHAIRRLELNIANPVRHLDRGEFKAPPARDTYVREVELAGFIGKILAISVPGREWMADRARDYMLLTLLYGTRKNELLCMQWDWINWADGVLTIPATVTKQKKVHHLPLTTWTRGILEARYEKRKLEVPFVFPGNKVCKPLTSIRKSLGKAVGKAFRLHDARRTLVTHCESLGIHGSRLKAIVGHARAGVTESYNQREIEQVRRDLTTYHDWLRQLHLLGPMAREEMDRHSPKPQAIRTGGSWPGVMR
jgi:integrase